MHQGGGDRGDSCSPRFWHIRRHRRAAAARRITTCPPSLRKLLRSLINNYLFDNLPKLCHGFDDLFQFFLIGRIVHIKFRKMDNYVTGSEINHTFRDSGTCCPSPLWLRLFIVT